MSQHDFDIANQGFPATRADLNNALQAAVSNSAGASAPSTTYAYQFWYDTSTNIIKMRNSDNDAWISIMTLDQANDDIASFTVNGPLTATGAFTSPGIDDNADATAITIDSSENVLVGKTTTAFGTQGVRISTVGSVLATSDGNAPAELNRLTSAGSILGFFKDSSSMGSIGTDGSRIYIGTGDTGLYFYTSTNAILPWNTSTNSERDAAVDLGGTIGRFKDLYLSGGAYLGGTAAANHLDSYEEGTFTPATTVGTISVADAAYTKVGRKVTVHFNAYSFSDRSSTNHIEFTNMPFTSDSSIGSTANSGMHRYVNAGDSLAFYMPRNQSKIQLFSLNSGSGWTPTQYSHLNSTSAEMYVHLTYFTAS